MESNAHSPSPSRLMLLDGHNLVYRSYFAIRGLSRSDGRATNATFGFLKVLEMLRLHWHPTHWCVVFDGGLPEERLAALPEYKAQRKPMPDDLRPQFGDIQEYLALAGVPFLLAPGQEADDLIASAAIQAEGDGALVDIVSSDKDLAQLCTESVRIISPAEPTVDFGPDGVEARMGVPPRLIADWLALTGDTVDNIPGVPGVGPKTAARILAQCPVLDELWNRLDALDLTPRIRSLLREHRAAVERNRMLTPLRKDLPLPSAWSTWRCQPASARAVPWLESMEFHSLANAQKQPELF